MTERDLPDRTSLLTAIGGALTAGTGALATAMVLRSAGVTNSLVVNLPAIVVGVGLGIAIQPYIRSYFEPRL